MLSMALFLLSAGLIAVDGIVTWQGLSRGFHETNPVLRLFLQKFGTTGLAVTRIAAIAFLFLLFLFLETWEWILFSTIFLVVMGCVVLVNVRKLN